MKLNYRDKVILGVFLAIVIVVAGYLALIKGKTADIKSHKSTLSTKQSEESKVKAQIARIPGLKEDITTSAKEANDITKNFVKMANVQNTPTLDQYMQHYADKNGIRLDSLELTGMTDTALEYYYIEPLEVGEDLRTVSDLSGKLQANYDEENAEKNQLENRETETLIQTQYAFTAHGTKEHLWNFMSDIENCKEAIIINELHFALREEEEEEEEEDTEEATVASDEEEEEKQLYITNFEDDTELDIQVVISLYSVYDAQAPALELSTEEAE